MGKYVITENQLKKVVYTLLTPKVIGIYVEDLSRYPEDDWRRTDVDSHYIVLNIMGKKKFTITHKVLRYKDRKDEYNIYLRESLVLWVSKILRIRKVKAIDIIADWVEDTYGLDVENIEFSDSSYTHGITKYLKKIK
tara:strand:+ start:278 stop:688 length:411 start_codon:yes stop_codon:yes gene_type:complete